MYEMCAKHWTTLKKLIYLRAAVGGGTEEYTGDVVQFETARSKKLKNLIVNLSPIQAGSGDPSPENIRPITGRTSASAWRTGKNLLKLDENEMVSSGWNRIFPISLQAGTYIISCRNDFGASNKGASVSLTDENDQHIIKQLNTGYNFGNGDYVGVPTTLSSEEAKKVKWIRFALRASGATFSDISVGEIQLELGDEPSTCEPYSGNLYSVDWTDEAGTVYSGTVDIVTGVLRVLWKMIDLGDLTWGFAQTAFYNTSSPLLTNFKYASTTAERKTGMLCSAYPFSENASYSASQDDFSMLRGNGTYAIRIKDSSYNGDTNAFKAGMSGVQLCFELDEPLTFQLSPQEVMSLVGSNVVWSEDGKVTVRV